MNRTRCFEVQLLQACRLMRVATQALEYWAQTPRLAEAKADSLQRTFANLKLQRNALCPWPQVRWWPLRRHRHAACWYPEEHPVAVGVLAVLQEEAVRGVDGRLHALLVTLGDAGVTLAV